MNSGKLYTAFKLALSSSLLLGTFSVSAAADEVKINEYNASSLASSSKTISVNDIVPKAYLSAVKGNFKSQKEIEEATGFKNVKKRKIAPFNKIDNGAVDNGVIVVNNLDEYAALLTYYNDLQSITASKLASTDNNSLSNNLNSTISIASTYTTTAEKTVWDDPMGFSWIKAYVTMTKNSSTGVISGSPTTDSQLYGFHPGNSWSHSSTRSSVTLNSKKTGGSATIVGDRTLSIIFEGIGNIVTKQETYYMSF